MSRQKTWWLAATLAVLGFQPALAQHPSQPPDEATGRGVMEDPQPPATPADLQAAGLQKAVEESKRFAAGEYKLALMRGSTLSPQEWNDVAAKVARYTGLSAEYVKQANLRPEIQAFDKELLRDQRITVGRLDSRFRGRDRDATGSRDEFDPSIAAITGPFAFIEGAAGAR